MVRVVGVQDWLLELLDECFLMQAGEVEPVEVSRPPELSLLQLLLVDCLIGERHDTKVGLGWEEASIWFQEHVTCDYVGLEHALI